VISKKDAKAAKEAYRADLARRAAEVAAAKKELRPENRRMAKRRRVKSYTPRTVADTIPYVADYDDGLIEVEPNRFSKSYLLSDINYKTYSEDGQVSAFTAYAEFLNYFSEDLSLQVTIDNRIISMSEQEEKVYYKATGDGYDRHRAEYNKILKKQIVAGRNDIRQNKYVTVAIEAETPIEALYRFHRIDVEIIANIKRTGAVARVMSTKERLEVLHDKFRPGHEGQFHIDYEYVMKQGLSCKDYIAPSSFYFGKSKEFMIGEHYYRVLTLGNLPASLSDEFLTDCASCEFPLVITKSVQSVAQDKALRLVRRQITGMEANKIEAEKRALRAGYSPETINHDLKHSLAQATELLDDMLNKDQKMFFVTVLMMVHGATEDELNENAKTLTGKVRKYTCQLRTLTYQQEEGMRLTLPLGYSPRHLSVERTLTTESTAVFIPFSTQELFQEGGFYYGLNQQSKNLIICNRTSMKTPSGFILGSSGSGKSFAAKREMLNVLLNDGRTGLLVIDPENEYGDFTRTFEGTVVKISADSQNYINPMDMPEDYGLDEDDGDDVPTDVKAAKALRKKSDYIMSIIERMASPGGSGDTTYITPQQKTIVDRCVKNCYRQYTESGFDARHLPTLMTLQGELDREKAGGEDARQLAEAVEYYTKGSMDIFSHRTNVDIDNRFVTFNLRDLSDQLRPIASIIVFDFIWNRMIDNKAKGVRTYCYCDEIHTMFSNYYSAYFLKQFYKRGRKYGLVITGITQNMEELLRSEMARGMIGNSDFLLMLSQSADDLDLLARMLNLSPEQRKYLENAEPGSGLLRAEEVVVPFMDKFPEDSYLFRLISTKFIAAADQKGA
jgi:type IV secretory pathway VirB4 component